MKSTREVIVSALIAIVLGILIMAYGLAQLNQLDKLNLLTAIFAAWGCTIKVEGQLVKPREELLKEIRKRIYDPGKYVKRIENKDSREPLTDWQTRAVMTIFEVVDVREVGDKVTIVARTPFKDK